MKEQPLLDGQSEKILSLTAETRFVAAGTLLNDHDPVPLYYQFAAQWPEAFTWVHLVKGPAEFRIQITKLKATAPPAKVAECCGGH